MEEAIRVCVRGAMSIFDSVFPLGVGTNRLPINDVSDEAGLEKSARLIATALESGCSYIDVAWSYSRGMAELACRRAFTYTTAPRYVTIKSSFSQDKTAYDALKRAERSMENMGLGNAAYFVIWGIKSYDEFAALSRPGGLLDGALECKKRGLVDHICFSTHAPVKDIISIMKSGVFEGVTISMSPLNFLTMEPVVETAEKLDIGVAIMNPLGGGNIPQNMEYFSFLSNGQERTVEGALRLLKAYSGVKILISGISNEAQLEENINAIRGFNTESDRSRIARVTQSFQAIEGFCTGCGYCDGCPVNIPISSYMQSRNALLYPPVPTYHRTNPALLRDIQLFRKLNLEFVVMPDTSQNPCIHCGACERKCTQRLEITRALDEIFEKCRKRGYSMDVRRNRLQMLIESASGRKIAFFPAGGYLHQVLEMSELETNRYELMGFDNNPALWNTTINGLPVYSPEQIPELKPDLIIIVNYNYQDEIYDSIQKYVSEEIEVKKFHDDSDVPWVF